MRLIMLIIFLAVAGCTYEASYIGPESDTRPVRLRITNASADHSLRCLLSMAHFITRDIAPIAAGKHAVIELQRGVKSDTLYYQENTTPLMAVENIYCGIDQAWAETKNNLNISALRSGNGKSYHVACTINRELVCTVQNDG